MKQFKDPIYGYINIPKDIVNKIIDTPTFQRLRYIQQTSYLPVYSAALHNRFIHSLGVYFLGDKACIAITDNSKDILDEFQSDQLGFNIIKIFKLACLLHDVGHAPFSHSGEDFFIDETKSIYSNLISSVDDHLFSTDVEYYHKFAKPAAPHEIMSVIVSIKQFAEFFPNAKTKDFFARCITGYKYRDIEINPAHAVLNAFICLLNSTTIDVDRLDYLIRDAFVMGYNSISIDYNRLLGSLILVKVQDSTNNTPIQLAYKKSALSVIENVIYAHDSEKKWVQNHPIIAYEVFLIQQIIGFVQYEYKHATGKSLFSLESLLPHDHTTQNSFFENAYYKIDELINKLSTDESSSLIITDLQSIKADLSYLRLSNNIHLLCDDDIIHIAKSIDHPLCSELFNRVLRRHPVWKSESEYKVFIDGYVGDNTYPVLQQQVGLLNKFINEEVPSHSINDEALKICREKLTQIESYVTSPQDKENMRDRYNSLLKWIEAFKTISKDASLKYFDFLIVPASKFESGFKKHDLSEMPIYFPECRRIYALKELINLFSLKEEERKKYFYVYYKREFGEHLDPLIVGKAISKLALE